MRGDSLRDLYAKVLALCGLGLLAGAGALVDYWPVQADLPRVASRQPDPAPPPPPGLSIQTPVRLAHAVTSVEQRRVPAPVGRARRADPFPSSAVPVEMVIAPEAIVGASAVQILDPPPEPAPPIEPPPVVALAVPLPQDDSVVLDSVPLQLLPAPVNHEADEDGFFSGAFKKTGAVASASLAKTGDVILKGGAVAGASIVDVFRGLAGAVKKVTPFVP